MNEFLRAVARVCGVHVSLLRMWCSAWADVSCGVLVAWLFCGRGAALVAARETQRLLWQKPTRRSGAPGRTVGEVEDKFEETAA